MKLYIDCDPGVDDAFALGYFLTRKGLDIVGIGSVSGNVNFEKVNKNLQLIVSAIKPEIKIFKGSSKFIVENPSVAAEHYHGPDGLGEFWKSEYYENNKKKINETISKLKFSENSAVFELIELSKKYDKSLVIAALGPLTNIALAQLIDPEFGQRVKEIFIMGGNYKGPGNSLIYVRTEFNFSMDPESVQIVLNRMQCPKHIYTIDAIGTPLVKKEYFDKWNSNELFKQIFQISHGYISKKFPNIHFYDLVLAIIVLHPEVVLKKVKKSVTIDLTGSFSRGFLIIDEQNHFLKDDPLYSKERHKFSSVSLIEELDEQKIIDLIRSF